jgi:hypothetical protein
VNYAYGHTNMGYYEIIVDSYLDNKRLRDFEGMDFKYLEGGKTILSGTLVDQAVLFSVINKIRDMNLTLVSIKKDNNKMEIIIE